MTRGAEPWDLKIHVVRKGGDPGTAAAASTPDANKEKEPASEPPCLPKEDPKEAESTAKLEGDQKQAPTDASKTARKPVVRVDQR